MDNRIVVGSLALLMTAIGMSIIYLLSFQETRKVVIEANPSNIIEGTDFTTSRQVAN